MEDIIQGMSRRKLIEIGSAIALSGVGVAQQASPMSQVPTRVSPQNKPLDEESPDSVWPPSTDHSDMSTFKYSFFICP
ncbi:MAG: hypothetical protein QOF94_3136 [Acidobacteriaceae bacterium]|jgi:hypothetical protein